MRRSASLPAAACLLLLVPALLAAQEAGHGPGVPIQRSLWRGVAHYGKWVTAAGAVGLTVLGIQEHHNSSREWDQLLAICRTNNADCTIGSNGRYADYLAELHYEKAIYYDHRARHRLLGGQLSLLASAAMFIADLRPNKGPGNIPFHAMQVTPRPGGDGLNVGVRLAL